MTVTFPLVVLLGVVLFLVWRWTPAGGIVLGIAALFGFYLAQTDAEDNIDRGVRTVVNTGEDVAGAAK